MNIRTENCYSVLYNKKVLAFSIFLAAAVLFTITVAPNVLARHKSTTSDKLTTGGSGPQLAEIKEPVKLYRRRYATTANNNNISTSTT